MQLLYKKTEYGCRHHPAYTDSSLPTVRFRENPEAALVVDGDVEIFVNAFYKVAALADPPLRFPIHRMSISSAREKSAALLHTANTYESWSYDIYL